MAKKKVTKKKKSNAGAPSKYKPEYCDKIIEVMGVGASLTSFAAEINVHKDTVYEWMKEHPEFSVASKIARQKCQHWWEVLLRGTATGKVKGNLGAQVFWMKNRFKDDWKDKLEYEADIRNLTPVIIEDDEGKTTTITMEKDQKK